MVRTVVTTLYAPLPGPLPAYGEREIADREPRRRRRPYRGTARGRPERICSGFGGLLSFAAMPIGMIEQIGRNTNNAMAMLGDFTVFAGRMFRWLSTWWFKWKNIRLLLPLMYEVGVRSVPVVGVTGAFIGMVMAIELYSSFKSIGQETRMGSAINLSVVKQIGPVLSYPWQTRVDQAYWIIVP